MPKIGLLTGAARGIGYMYAEKLLQCGGVKHITIFDLPTSVGEKSAKKLNSEFGEGRAIFVGGDVTKECDLKAAFEKTVDKFGGIDLLINNAGFLHERKWELMIDINVNALVRGTMLGLQYMGKDKCGKGGVIVNVASIFGIDPWVSFPVYDGTKHFVMGYTRSFGNPYYYNKTGVKILTMCPGITDTMMVSGAAETVMDEFMDKKSAIEELKTYKVQKVDNVADGMVQIIQSAKNGTVWLSEGGKPVREIVFPGRFCM